MRCVRDCPWVQSAISACRADSGRVADASDAATGDGEHSRGEGVVFLAVAHVSRNALSDLKMWCGLWLLDVACDAICTVAGSRVTVAVLPAGTAQRFPRYVPTRISREACGREKE